MSLRIARLPRPLATFVQPIVDTSTGVARVFAVECLTRGPRGSRLEEALPLFDYVRRRGLEREMDRTCIAQALRSTAACDCRISINVHPTTLTDAFVPFLLDHTRRASIEPSRLIIEIGEQSPSADPTAFRRAIAALRQHGVGVAVDDVGYGHSNLYSILEARPEYLKIDRYFVEGVADDSARVAAIESIQRMGEYLGARVIAEGIERRDDLEVLRLLGIDLFQGFLFSRPAALSGDGAEHPLVDWVLQDDGVGEQPLVDRGLEIARQGEGPVDVLQDHQQRSVEGLALGALEGMEGEAAADQVCVD